MIFPLDTMVGILNGSQRMMERSIPGFESIDHVRYTMLRSMTGTADLGSQTAGFIWEKAGHISKMQSKKWANVVTP